MTWSEQEGSVVLTDAYTLVYVSRQYSRTFLSDTRHTSFYADLTGCCIYRLLFHSQICFQLLHLVFGIFIASGIEMSQLLHILFQTADLHRYRRADKIDPSFFCQLFQFITLVIVGRIALLQHVGKLGIV